MKLKVCPICKSTDVFLYMPHLGTYRCRNCGYTGFLILTEDVKVLKNDKSKKRNQKSKKSI